MIINRNLEDIEILPLKHQKTLELIKKALEKTELNWVITGSTAFAMQGIEMLPNDIDIQTDKKGAYEIQKIFSNNVVDPVYFKISKKIKSHYGKLLINNLQIEIMGDMQKFVDNQWEKPIQIKNYRKLIKYKDKYYPVLDLQYEYEAYLKLGRKEKANIIKNALDKL